MEPPNNQHRQTPEANTLIIEDRVLSGGFVQLPKLILQARNLSRDAKLLYAILLSYAWQAGRCFPGYKRLCEDMQAGETMVRKYMQELERLNLLVRRRRGLGQTNIYTLKDISSSRITDPEPSKSEVLDPHSTEDKEYSEEKDTNLRDSKSIAGDKSVRNPVPPAEPHRESRLVAEMNLEVRNHMQPSEPLHQLQSRSKSRSLGLRPIADIIAGRSKLSRISDSPNPTRLPQSEQEHTNNLDAIAVAVSQIAFELGNSANLSANLSQARNLYRTANIPESSFVSLLMEARALTRDRMRPMRSSTSNNPLHRPMAYYWRVVRDILPSTPTKLEATTESDGQHGTDQPRDPLSSTFTHPDSKTRSTPHPDTPQPYPKHQLPPG